MARFMSLSWQPQCLTASPLCLCSGCRLRVVEHNILVVSQYYSRITMQRLSQLLCLNAEEVSQGTLTLAVASMTSLLCIACIAAAWQQACFRW